MQVASRRNSPQTLSGGNSFKLADYNNCRETVIQLYEDNLLLNEKLTVSLGDLKGKNLGCWCFPLRCHAEVLHRLAGNHSQKLLDMDTTTEASSSNSVISTVTSTPVTSSTMTVSSNRRVTRGNTGATVHSTYMRTSASPPGSPRVLPKLPSSPGRSVDSITPKTSPTSSIHIQLKAHEEETSLHHEMPTLLDLKQQVAAQQKQIQSLEHELEKRDLMINRIHQRLDSLDKQSSETRTVLHVKDIVIDRLRTEVTKLQQYTRRYSVVIAGIEKKERKESREYLKTEVEKVLHEVNSGVTMDDVDKFHRNGPYNEGKQDVIVRFKAHSDKESFYKGRKQVKNKAIKIRPSLSDNNRKLLNQAVDYLDTFHTESSLPNPPHFVMANIHGEIQLKMTEEHNGQLFFTIHSMRDLVETITRLNYNAQDDDRFYVSDSDDDSEI